MEKNKDMPVWFAILFYVAVVILIEAVIVAVLWWIVHISLK